LSALTDLHHDLRMDVEVSSGDGPLRRIVTQLTY
jgi:hypothetical protein